MACGADDEDDGGFLWEVGEHDWGGGDGVGGEEPRVKMATFGFACDSFCCILGVSSLRAIYYK